MSEYLGIWDKMKNLNLTSFANFFLIFLISCNLKLVSFSLPSHFLDYLNYLQKMKFSLQIVTFHEFKVVITASSFEVYPVGSKRQIGITMQIFIILFLNFQTLYFVKIIFQVLYFQNLF